MTELKIISTLEEWNNHIQLFDNIDCYYSFEYGQLFANIEEGTIKAAYFETEDSRLFYPFIKRRIEVAHSVEPLYDIVTPYGYGGPYFEGDCSCVDEFYKHFKSYCQASNIITETVRFHPLYGNEQHCSNIMDVQYVRLTTGVQLNEPLDTIRANYSSMTKRNVKKARNNGVTCYVADHTEQNIRIFINMYKETMKRNHATSYYYFDDHYFYEQMKNTLLNETALLFAEYDNEIVAGVIVLIGKKYAHYHLGASKTNFLQLRANHCLFDYMIEYCYHHQSEVLHLGGGYAENDGLFHYKSSFTNNNHYKYYIGKNIFDQDAYDALVETVKHEYIVNENYFPLYRAFIERRELTK